MSPALGAFRGLQECASARGRFTIVALDHRQNLRRMLRPSDPSSVPVNDLVEFKREAVRALGPLATAVLLDPELGAGQCIADGSLPGHAGLVVSLEATGYLGPPDARVSRMLEGWSASKARRLGASAAKLLVYYHPDAANASQQEQLVSGAVTQCRGAGLPLFVEPVVYPVGPPFEGEERRRAIIRTAARMSELGADVLKLQFPYGPEVTDQARRRDACAEVTSAVTRPWVLLSGEAGPEEFVDQAEVACRQGAAGIACGRGIWTEAPSLSGEARRDFFNTTARTRLEKLRDVVESHARPWSETYPPAEEVSEGWYLRD